MSTLQLISGFEHKVEHLEEQKTILQVALKKIVEAKDIFYDPHNGKYFSELQTIAREALEAID